MRSLLVFIAFVSLAPLGCASVHPVDLHAPPGKALTPYSVARVMAGVGWIPESITATRVASEWSVKDGALPLRVVASLRDDRVASIAVEVRVNRGWRPPYCRDHRYDLSFPPTAADLAHCRDATLDGWGPLLQDALSALVEKMRAQLEGPVALSAN